MVVLSNRLLLLTLTVLVCLSFEGVYGLHSGKARRRRSRRKRAVEKEDKGEEPKTEESVDDEPEDRLGLAVMTVGAPASEEMGFLDMTQMYETINNAHNEFMVDVKNAMIEAEVDDIDCTFMSKFLNIYKVVDVQNTAKEKTETRMLESADERSLELTTEEEEMDSGGLTTKELHSMLTGVCYMCSDDNDDADTKYRRELHGRDDEDAHPLTFEDMSEEDAQEYKALIESGDTYSLENIALRTFNVITGPEGREYFKDISCVCITFPFGTEIASHDTAECKNACIDFPVVLDYDPTDEDKLGDEIKKDKNKSRLKKLLQKLKRKGKGKKKGNKPGGIFGRKLR